MRKSAIIIALAIMVLLSTSACTHNAPGNAAYSAYYPDNEITTTENLYDDRMIITIDTQYNVATANIADVVEAKFPEVNVLLRLHNTPDTLYFTKKAMELNQLGDILFCAVTLPKDGQLMDAAFIDLSDAPFINNYYQNTLDGVAIDGKIYMLPGFSDIFGIVYDRTLFEARGWELPGSRDEFIALCGAIRAEEGYQAFMPTLKYGRMAMLLSHAFHYDSVIAGFDNQQWLQAYRRGDASFIGHMEPLFQGMKELFDAGVLSEECFTMDAGVRSSMLYKDYTTAMTMEKQIALTYAENANTEHTYGMMPFWSSNEPDSDYLISATGFNIFVNKQLEAPENAEKLNKVMEILAYFSTPEGQQALMTEESTGISNVKDTAFDVDGDFMQGVAATIAKGNIVPEVRYTELGNNNPFQVAFREALMGYVSGDMDMRTAMAYCDAAMKSLNDAAEPEETVYGVATQTFTIMETAAFVADILREDADADVALVLAKQLAYGEAGNFYEGNITDSSLKMVSLDYETGKAPEYNQLVTVNLTGAQLLAILNYNSSADTRTMWTNSDTPSYWVCSNLKVEYAPLMRDKMIASVTHMDGSALDLNKTYKVAIWNGCFHNLMETGYFDAAALEAMTDVTPISQQSSIELIKAKIVELGEISPPDDERYTIRWDMVAE